MSENQPSPDEPRSMGRTAPPAAGTGPSSDAAAAGALKNLSNSEFFDVSDADRAAVAQDLGREPRGLVRVGARCSCGRPLVVVTAPRLPDGSPFPTMYYLTSPSINTACSRLEASHFMTEMAERLAADAELRVLYENAHHDYLDRRGELAEALGLAPVTEIEGISAGGMPTRVKCLHALVAHSLAAGPGVNPIGDLTLEEIGRRGWWSPNKCACSGTGAKEVTRVAAIDCGTNSIRLLIADVEKVGLPSETAGGGQAGAARATVGSNLTDIDRDMVITRLGEGVDRTGNLDPTAVRRSLDVITAYQQRIDENGATRVRVVATSATRDAANRQIFVDGVRAITSKDPEVITGSQEAELSFRGALSSLPPALEGPYLVVDIGGGSTEFVLGTTSVSKSVSVDMGSVRITERFGPEPWTIGSLVAAREWIDARLDEAAEVIDFSAAQTLVGVAGTVTTLAGYIYDLDGYTPSVTHGATPTANEWRKALRFMIEASVDEKAALGIMPPGRADVIGGGALVWERVLQRVLGEDYSREVQVVVSEHDILDGLALSLG